MGARRKLLPIERLIDSIFDSGQRRLHLNAAQENQNRAKRHQIASENRALRDQIVFTTKRIYQIAKRNEYTIGEAYIYCLHRLLDSEFSFAKFIQDHLDLRDVDVVRAYSKIFVPEGKGHSVFADELDPVWNKIRPWPYGGKGSKQPAKKREEKRRPKARDTKNG